MEYYHDLVTQKSFSELQNLKKLLNFVLIGGWAVYLYTNALKSKDIDIIVGFEKLPLLKEYYTVLKNDRLKKYEAIKEEVQIDIYLPHYSNLAIPVEDLISQTQIIEGFTILEPNFLSVLKIYLLSQRGRSAKGRKDFLDFLSLTMAKKCNLPEIKQILKKYHLATALNQLKDFLNEQTQIPELNLSTHSYPKIKKMVLSGLL